jgi:hypothetical protein
VILIANSTTLNGLVVRGRAKLASGDEIRIGDTLLCFGIDEPIVAARNEEHDLVDVDEDAVARRARAHPPGPGHRRGRRQGRRA